MGFLVLLNQSVLPIFIILAVAYIYFRVYQPDIKQLVNISLYTFSPAVVFNSLIKEGIGFSEIFKYLVLMVLVTAALMALGYIGAKLLRLSKTDVILFVMSVSMINIGNFGVPLIFFTYGQEGIYPSILTFISFNLPLVTIAIYLASGEPTIKGNVKDVLKIPIFHAAILALIIASFEIPVPEVIMKVTGFLGQAAFPFMIFILGLQLATIKLNPGLIKAALASVGIKLVAAPFVIAAILGFMSFEGLSYSVALIQLSGPSAILPLMYAIRFGRNADLLAAAILLSTALSAITLPIVIYFAG
ncbi:MAG: hypothetical protein C0602_04630 [Denitrovibrio sp.]|nr:MAG: hypothetical protein C0602_04630 [Denitrovibrio sp.]